ncbi:energy-coupling factor ABC transporter ATP-binding protein [Candidatus Riflebacteria bacterium]
MDEKLVVRNLDFSIDKFKLLQNISFELSKGVIYPLFGPSGAGKSTLAKILAGILHPDSGELNYSPNDSALVFQFSEDMLFMPSVRDEWCFPLQQQGLEANEIENKVQKISNFLNFPTAALNQSPFFLSGGYKKLAALGAILILKPAFLILDEPASGLDMGLKATLLQNLKNYVKQEKCFCLMITHDLDFFMQENFSGFFLQEGKLIRIKRDEILYKDVDAGLPLEYLFLKKLATSNSNFEILKNFPTSFEEKVDFINQI